MWVYRSYYDSITKCHQNEVGYYNPEGHFQFDSVWNDKDSASSRVNFLNGGTGVPPTIVTYEKEIPKKD